MTQVSELAESALFLGQCGGHLLRGLGIVPQAGVGGFGFELSDFLIQGGGIEDLLDGGEGRIEVGDGGAYFGLHNRKV